MSEGRVLRGIEVHSGLSALLAEHTTAKRPDGSEVGFDFLWSSSLTGSTVRGKPDIECVDTSQRVAMVEEAFEVTTKPMVYDGDTGGLPEIFSHTVRTLERVGVSAVIIEDKQGLKQNSLFGTDRQQSLADINEFSRKIAAGKAAQVTEEFMVVARLEALIAGAGQAEAIKRAQAYIDAGVDGIMIHSKEKSPDEVFEFMEAYNKFANRKPLVVVPTTYNSVSEEELAERGAALVIHANQLIRAAYPAMQQVAQKILANGRSKEVDGEIMSVKDILTLIDKA